MERTEPACDRRISLWVPDGLKQRLWAAAKEDRRSVNNYIRQLLSSALEDERAA